jgi:hypothetical protein
LAREVGRLRYQHLSYPATSEQGLRFQALRPLRRRLFFAEDVLEEERPAFSGKLRDKLRAERLNAKSASAWEETDLVCDSKLF